MRQCPKCNSDDIHRSRAKSTWETWWKGISSKRPYRCSACGWRGWRADAGPRVDDEQRRIVERANAPAPPNLTGTLLTAAPRRPDTVNLHALDLPMNADVVDSNG